MIAAHLFLLVFLIIHFRRHVRARAVEARRRELAFQLRFANVAQIEVPRVIHQDVSRLDVAVINALFFKEHQRLRHFNAQAEDAFSIAVNLIQPLFVVMIQRHANQNRILAHRFSARVHEAALQILRLFAILHDILFPAEAVHDLRLTLARRIPRPIERVLLAACHRAVHHFHRIGHEFQRNLLARFPV